MTSGRAAIGALVILLVGVFLSSQLADEAERHARELATTRFQSATEHIRVDLTRRLEQPVYGLRGGRAALNTHPLMHREMVRKYVLSRDLDREFPGVRGIGFIERTTRADLPEFLRRQRDDGAPEFSISALSDSDDPLYVITTIEPLERNESAWGFDVGSEPHRRAAVERAIVKGMTMTAPVKLRQDPGGGPGALIMVPVFKPGMPHGTPEERREALRGLFYVPIVAQELFSGAANAADGAVDFDLYDVTDGAAEVLFDADGHHARGVPVRTAGFKESRSFPFGGRTLRLDTFSLPEFEAEFANSGATQRRWLGGLLSLACALVVLALSRSRAKAIELATAMTDHLRDATRRAERVIFENDQLYRTINTHFLVSTADRGGRILSVNAAMCALSGYTEAELVGVNHRIVNSGMHPRQFWTDMWATLKAGNMWRGEVCNRKKDGSLYWVDTLIAPLAGAEGTDQRYISIRADITARKQAETELAAQTRLSQEFARRADDANQAKSSFLANMSHEIRTPMNGVLGMTELLLGMGLTQEQEETARTVYRSADALLVILNDILDFSKIEAGKLDYERLAFDLPQVLYDTAELFKAKVAGRDVRLLVRIAADAPCEVWGDPTRVRQIVINLLGNAVKFTEHGHVMLELDRGPEHFVVRVVDTGPGIPADRQVRLFEPFTQADASMSRRHGGTGLGLAISRRLAHGMRGDLRMRSVVGEGTTFELTLPLDEVAPPTVTRALEGQRILVADRSTAQRCIVSEQLEGAGAQVVGVSGSAEALTELAQGAFDAVVWTEGDVPTPLATGLGHVVQSAGRLRSHAGATVVSTPCRTSVLVEALSTARRRTWGERDEASRVLLALPLPPRPVSRPHQGAEVLVVDDNAINLRVARAMLERLGCEVTTAGNGRDAVELVKQRDWAVVFMDCEMPEIDGYEATAHIRALEEGGPRTPIIAMTANAGVEDRTRCLSAGMDAFIAKPCRSRDFEEVLSRWLTVDTEASTKGPTLRAREKSS